MPFLPSGYRGFLDADDFLPREEVGMHITRPRPVPYEYVRAPGTGLQGLQRRSKPVGQFAKNETEG